MLFAILDILGDCLNAISTPPQLEEKSIFFGLSLLRIEKFDMNKELAGTSFVSQVSVIHQMSKFKQHMLFAKH